MRGFLINLLRFWPIFVNSLGIAYSYAYYISVRKLPVYYMENTISIKDDEFPQLLNILKGDMNIIGPRPERPEFVKQLSEKIPFYDVRHVIKPGLIGWAQVNHNYGTSHDDALIKLQYDLYYIKNRSIFLDLSIYIKTLSTVLFMRGQ